MESILNELAIVQHGAYILVGAEKVSHDGGSNKVRAPLWERFGPNLLFALEADRLPVCRLGTILARL